ncbi:hypothetical protein HMN09_00918300 [Mycena chlorophos]|uniref:Uncharacterized protein n=1 Tax=Mycena chlorophos TaxID=658473 RepID=A0A8H6SIK4_MYCCL|nr:hypothetical protein HMN09_00918300 [Mycena chlorophos]
MQSYPPGFQLQGAALGYPSPYAHGPGQPYTASATAYPSMIPYVPEKPSKSPRFSNGDVSAGDSTQSVYGGSRYEGYREHRSGDGWEDENEDTEEETILLGGPRPRHRTAFGKRSHAVTHRAGTPIAVGRTPIRARTPVPGYRHARRVGDWVVDAQAHVERHRHGHSHQSSSHSHSKHHHSSRDRSRERGRDRSRSRTGSHSRSRSHDNIKQHHSHSHHTKSHRSTARKPALQIMHTKSAEPLPIWGDQVSRSLPATVPASYPPPNVQVSYIGQPLPQPVAAPMQAAMAMPVPQISGASYGYPQYAQPTVVYPPQVPQAYAQLPQQIAQPSHVSFAPASSATGGAPLRGILKKRMNTGFVPPPKTVYPGKTATPQVKFS